jgi:L-threonylcarbamoyladenylate synthase
MREEKHRLGVIEATLENVDVAAEIVRRGGLIVYPTDTVYGLGCDPFNVDAVERLVKVKGARDKPMPILASSLNHVVKVADLSQKARRVAERFWPGPLTLVLPKKLLPDFTTFGLSTVGVRMPNHPIALKLIELSGGLLVGTSANRSGLAPPLTADAAFEQLNDEVDAILDGGVSELGESSTVVDLTSAEPKLLRKGSERIEDILDFLQG